MKFGFESEKILYDLKDDSVFHGVFTLVDALSDYARFHGEGLTTRVTNEFVQNMVEVNTISSHLQREVIEDYLLLHQIVTDVALRQKVVPLPLASYPLSFTPSMVPKWAYYVQNCILSGKRLKEWALSTRSPLAAAANCAGLHAHFEIGTLPQFLVFTPELVHKHNMGLMLTPMTAFAASPYFDDVHEATSMRSRSYYEGVYSKYPLNGGLPPVMQTSEEVLRYTLSGIDAWIEAGMRVGFSREDMERIVAKKGPNWSMVRWNRTWNTIELRCLESDRVDYDISKFAWVAGAMKRLDPKGEALEPVALASRPLDEKLVDETFAVSGKQVTILPTLAIHELVGRAVARGLRDPLVERYLHRLHAFAQPGVDEDCLPTFAILKGALDRRESTSDRFLQAVGGTSKIDPSRCSHAIRELLQEELLAVRALRAEFPSVLPKHRSDLFPSATQPPSMGR